MLASRRPVNAIRPEPTAATDDAASDTGVGSHGPSVADDHVLWVRTGRMALVGALLTVVICCLGAWGAYLPYRAVAIYTIVLTALCLTFYGLVRSGASRRFADPTLTVPQLMAAGLPIAYLVYEGHEVRPAFLAMYIGAYMFGVFRLRQRGLVWLAVYYEACYVTAVVASFVLRPDVIDTRREVFRVVAFAMVMAWLAILGSYIGGLRRSLHETNERLARALRRAEELANHDALTGCLNRRRMLEMLAVEVHRARRGVTFSVCLVDLDHFKAVNDEHGHLAGDEVLKRFASAVQSMLRPTDFLARYGGEEFLVGLPQTSLESAVVVAERIQAMIEQTVFPGLALRRGVTVSIGVAEHQPAHTVERTLERVDEALYEAKAQGRNTVRSRPA